MGRASRRGNCLLWRKQIVHRANIAIRRFHIRGKRRIFTRDSTRKGRVPTRVLIRRFTKGGHQIWEIHFRRIQTRGTRLWWGGPRRPRRIRTREPRRPRRIRTRETSRRPRRMIRTRKIQHTRGI
jgi:hypothetical protein